jgi:hypothetical protein
MDDQDSYQKALDQAGRLSEGQDQPSAAAA